MEFEYTLTDEANEDVRRQIVAPLVQYNESKAGPSHYRPLVVTLSDDSGQIVGGLWAATGYGWLYIQLLVVPETGRGKKVGSRLMTMAEQEAAARGCHDVWVDTLGFQARGFYEKLGYTCFGELPNYPDGFSRFFLRKSLTAV